MLRSMNPNKNSRSPRTLLSWFLFAFALFICFYYLLFTNMGALRVVVWALYSLPTSHNRACIGYAVCGETPVVDCIDFLFVQEVCGVESRHPFRSLKSGWCRPGTWTGASTITRVAVSFMRMYEVEGHRHPLSIAPWYVWHTQGWSSTVFRRICCFQNLR